MSEATATPEDTGQTLDAEAVRRGQEERLEKVWETPKGWRYWSAFNNTEVGIWYTATSFAFMLFAGVLGLMVRVQLAVPENDFLTATFYNQVFTLHGTVMMFLFAVPIFEAVAIVLLPQMLGARDLPFPRLSAFGYWCFLIGGVFVSGSIFFGAAPEGGWFMYPPLTTQERFTPGYGPDIWLLGLSFIEVASIAAAVELERVLKSPERRVVSLGTGRALKATVEQLPRMACPQHVVVSRLGNMMQDGSASPYNATISLAERIGAPHYPYPLPVLARDPAELAAMRGQDAVRNTIRLSKQADLSLVGIGQMDRSAPLFVDGFVSRAEMDELAALGAVGEITSWVYDRGGQVIDCAFNARVASAPLPRASQRPVIAVATGEAKVPAIRAALVGRLVNGLVTSEVTAERLLAD